ncbi:MAG: hypothetical protein JKY48_08565 [Flavobacteriales bacterium]|nr:hypothetical protein [Flavobacteriales bacterium]
MHTKLLPRKAQLFLSTIILLVFTFSASAQTIVLAPDTVTVNMVALDQPFMFNRLGAAQPTGQMFALARDVVKTGTNTRLSDLTPQEISELAGMVSLREGKRPRPIVLRVNEGEFLKINFTNLLSPGPHYNTLGDSIPGDNLSPYSSGLTRDSIKFYPNTDPMYQNLKATKNGLFSFLPMTRMAGVHCMGLEMADNITSNGNWVGVNTSGLVQPGKSITYRLKAAEVGSFMLYSNAAPFDGNKTLFGGQLSAGLFGSVVVQPESSEYYRSQVSGESFFYATKEWIQYDNKAKGETIKNPYYGTKNKLPKTYKATNYSSFVNGQGYPKSGKSGSLYYPVIDYQNAVYPKGYPEVGTNQLVLNMLHKGELIYTDLTAIITGPNAGRWPESYSTKPSFLPNPVYPDRLQPYREYAIHYHEAFNAVQAFPVFYDSESSAVLSSSRDDFAINYGTGGIGAEIYANRIGIGPMAECVECAYEEFFLSSWSVGDPAMIVNTPANVPGIDLTQDSVDFYLQELLNKAIEPAASVSTRQVSAIRTNIVKPLYPDDPSNVYHSYMRDHVVFRINHGGPGVPHVHHQHAHQWLHSPNNDDGHYLDSQGITPGSSYSLDMVFNGSGNLNQTVGDQIFHCHFYPHFAAGMWGMWRVHDVLEVGTKTGSTGDIADDARAYPDVEITKGTFIPGLIPMPTLAMAPVPSKVILDDGGQIVVTDTTRNPGYPFFIPGVAGQRVPNPPLDFAIDSLYHVDGTPYDSVGSLNGGLPRSVFYVADGKTLDDYVLFESHNQYDWTKLTHKLDAIELPETGTASERIAMRTHAIRNHSTLTPKGDTGTFILNGLPAVAGAPFADPAMNYKGEPITNKRTYKAAGIQMDVILNKAGWHYPQQRFEVLWGDVAATLNNVRPPEPFFFRANSEEFVEFWHTNLVPEYYELDDYQVRTPTDILGQHIHLVKFDVTSSDGAANGWNYEDGTLAPGKVQERIEAINDGGSIKKYKYSKTKSILAGASTYTKMDTLKIQGPNPIWGSPPEKGAWNGANTTIQRWYADPVLNNTGDDRTLRTVFTHDHFGPSTHQQVGYYSGLIIEPANSVWIDPMTSDTMGLRLANNEPKPRKINTAYTNGVATGTTMNVQDGGPTSWQANIVTPNKDSSYRELMLEFQDMQFAYYPGGRLDTSIETKYPHWKDGDTDASFKKKVANTYLGYYDPNYAIEPNASPEVITSTVAKGTQSVNYRNEPLPVRLSDSVVWTSGSASGNGTLPGTEYHMTLPLADTNFVIRKPDESVSYKFYQGDPSKIEFNSSYAFSSRKDIKRGISYDINGGTNKFLQSQPTPGYTYSEGNGVIPYNPIAAEMQAGDPYTPLFRAYEGDRIQVRTLVGAHVSPHTFYMHGTKWLFEPSASNSGYKASQTMGISEHFEMEFKLPQTGDATADYLYATSIDDNGIKNGSWGIMRAYKNDSDQSQLLRLPNNPKPVSGEFDLPKAYGCPTNAPTREVNVTAIWVKDLGRPDGMVYNEVSNKLSAGSGNILNGMVFIPSEMESFLIADTSMPIEPLVIRARAGDCIKLTLTNKLRDSTITGTSTSNMQGFRPATKVDGKSVGAPSASIGLHADLVSYSVQSGDGANIGLNNIQTIEPGKTGNTISWYCGTYDEFGTPHPAEFGAVNLSPPDVMSQSYVGLYGALVVLPQESFWTVDNHVSGKNTLSAAAGSATVYKTATDRDNGTNPWFRDCVLMFEDNYNAGSFFYQPSINYKNASIVSRFNYAAEKLGNPILGMNTSSSVASISQKTRTNLFNTSQATSNGLVYDDPQTPVLIAGAGEEVRLRLLHTYGSSEGITFTVDGHVWQEEPWNKDSATVLGSTKIEDNPMSEWKGATPMVMAMTNYQLKLNSAGGDNKVPGDYQYRSYPSQMYFTGVWGILRVLPEGQDYNVQINKMELSSDSSKMTLNGNVSINTTNGQYADDVTLQYKKGSNWVYLGTANVNNASSKNGKWGNWTIKDITLSSISYLNYDTEFRIKAEGASVVYSPTYKYKELNDHAKFRPWNNKVSQY